MLSASGLARADDKAACSAAYDLTQSQRRDGKLSAARRSAIVCSREACAEFIRADCGRWLGEIDASQPTVVLEVLDAAGKDTTAARVELDGAPWLAELDDRSKRIDPGKHTLRYILEGGDTLEQTVDVREGEKNRKLTASFERKAAPAATPGTPDQPRKPPPAREGEPESSVVPWVIGGIGVASLVTGAVLGAMVLEDRSVVGDPTQCDPTLGRCTAPGYRALAEGRALGPASTAGLVAGGLGVAVSGAWLFARSRSGKKVEPSVSGAPWIIGGIGLTSLLVGEALGGVVLHDRSVVADANQCSMTPRMCTAAGYSALTQGRVLGPVSTAGLIFGGLGVGVAGVWLVARSRMTRNTQRSAITVGMGPLVTASAAYWRVQGAW